MLIQIIWNWVEFLHDLLGTYNMPIVAIGLLFALLGAIVSATGKVFVTGENITPDPNPNPSALKFVYSSRKKRFFGSFIIVLVILRVFSPQFSNITLLILFSFGVGFLNYLLTESFLNYLSTVIQKYLPGGIKKA